MNAKAQLLSAQGKLAEADALCHQVVEILEDGRGKHHSEVRSQHPFGLLIPLISGIERLVSPWTILLE